MTFAAITPALVIGAFAERLKFSAILAISLLWTALVSLPDRPHWFGIGRDPTALPRPRAQSKLQPTQPQGPMRSPRLLLSARIQGSCFSLGSSISPAAWSCMSTQASPASSAH